MDRSLLTLTSTLQDLPRIAQTLLHHAGDQRVWLLEGAMGAGKTTLVRALCAYLGVQDNVTSPTFSLIQEYVTTAGVPVYHFDFYRIQDEEEVRALDCLSYLECGHYCFIEWPARISHFFSPPYYKIRIITQPNGSRVLHVSYH